MNNLLCPTCGSEMEYQDAPLRHHLFRIPFTKLYLELWDWGHEELFCFVCAEEKVKRYQRDIYEAGQQDGYQKGYDDAQRE